MKKNFDVLRDFISRGEARMSTLQRIAGVFVTGAGLLIILPLLLKDYLPTLLGVIYEANFIDENIQLKLILYLALFILGFIPLYSVYQVIIGIAQFYFIKRKIGNYSYLRFYLTGITLPDDGFSEEGLEGGIQSKKEMVRSEFDNEQNINLLNKYLGHFSKSDLKSFLYYKNLTRDALIPPKRFIGGDNDVYFKDCNDNVHKNKEKIDILHTIYGLAGYSDVNTTDMVFDIETAVVRQTFYLRRLILTYIKAFLMMLFVCIVLGILHANITAASKHLGDINLLKNFEVDIIIGFYVCALIGGIFIDASLLTMIDFSERRQNIFRTLVAWIKNKFKFNTITDQKTNNFEHIILILFGIVMVLMNYLVFTHENYFRGSGHILFRFDLYDFFKWKILVISILWIIIFIVSIFVRWRKKINLLKKTDLGKGDFKKNVEEELEKII
mgnify:CR=1 FL=1|jgi:hypothetical protein